MPMQDGPELPEAVGRALWTIYAEVYGSDQSYERIVERHGFAYSEVPIWLDTLKRRIIRERSREA